MSKRTEERYEEIAAWIEGNVPRQGSDWEARWRFLVKILSNLMTLEAMVILDLQQLEQGGHSRLWLPGELNASGDLRKLG